MRTPSLSIALVLGFAALAHAGPLERRQVSADAKWLAHIDFDALKASTLAQRIRGEWLGPDLPRPPIERLCEHLGIEPQVVRAIRDTIELDLMRDFRSITFYGSRFARYSGIVIVRAKIDQQRLLDHLSKGPEYRTSRHGDHLLHSWTLRDADQREREITGCFAAADLAVVGRDAAEVKVALDVLDGRSPSLHGSGSPLDGDVPPGTLVVARAAGLAAAEVPLKSPVVRQSHLLALALGEHEGAAFAEATLVAKSPEVAAQVRTVVDGLIAAAKLQHDGDSHAMELLEAVKVTTSGPTVTVIWRQPADELFRLLAKAWGRQSL